MTNAVSKNSPEKSTRHPWAAAFSKKRLEAISEAERSGPVPSVGATPKKPKVHVRRSQPVYGMAKTACGDYLDIPGRKTPLLASKWSEVTCGSCRAVVENDSVGAVLSSKDYLALKDADKSKTIHAPGATKCVNCGAKLKNCRGCKRTFCPACFREFSDGDNGKCGDCQ